MISVLVSCEHATCAVPGGQKAIFEGREDELHSFAGWEPGALNLAQAIAIRHRTPLVHGEITRLLIDLEAGEDERWSAYSAQLSEQAKERFERRMWQGYRTTLRQRIEEDLRRHEAVVHVLAHTVGEKAGTVRMRTPEGATFAARLAGDWAHETRREHLDAGHVTGSLPGALIAELASAFPVDRYAAIRLEVAAGYFLDNKPLRWDECKKSIIAGLDAALKA